jgi:hypothetical protein
MKQLAKFFWFTLAAIFLIEAWLWEYVGGFFRWLYEIIPLAALKAALARGIDRLPAPLALVLFVIPIILLEPLKVVAIWMLGHHHVIWGVATFAFAEAFTAGIVAFLFDAMRDKLLSMRWFFKLYEWVLWANHWAHDLVRPYKEEILAKAAELRLWVKEKLAAHGQSPFIRRLIVLREQVRRARKSA